MHVRERKNLYFLYTIFYNYEEVTNVNALKYQYKFLRQRNKKRHLHSQPILFLSYTGTTTETTTQNILNNSDLFTLN